MESPRALALGRIARPALRLLLAVGLLAPALPEKVVLVLLDDVGKDLLADAHTPSLDLLAQRARIYRRFWASPMCSPTRAAILSGLEAHRAGNLMGGNTTDYELPITARLLPRLLPGSSTYRGKLHVAPVHRTGWPLQAGFGDWSGTTAAALGTGYYGWWWVREGGREWCDQYATEVVAREVMGDIAAGTDFVYAAFHAAHTPFHVPPRELAPYSWTHEDLATDLGQARAMTEALDTALGWVADAALSKGYVLIIASDNGTSKKVGGEKGTLREAGICVPLFVLGPEVDPGVSDALVQATDLWATVLEARGVASFPVAEDSVSFWPEATRGAPPGRRYLRSQTFFPAGAAPDPLHWKRAVRDSRWKLISHGSQTVPLFYDLEADPRELDDLMDGPLTQEQTQAYQRLLDHLPE